MSQKRSSRLNSAEHPDTAEPSNAQSDSSLQNKQVSRWKLRLPWYGACALGALGFAVLWFAVRAVISQYAPTRVGWTKPVPAGVSGTIVEHPEYDPESGTLTIQLDAGAQGTRLVTYRGDLQVLFQMGKLPTIGDQLMVKVAEDVGSAEKLTVVNPDDLVIVRPEPIDVRIAAVTNDQIGHKIRTRGMVRLVNADSAVGVELVIRDETGQIRVVYDDRLIQMLGTPADVSPGDSVSVRGVPLPTGSGLAIALDSADGLARLDTRVPIAPRKSIGDIDAGDADHMTCIEGAVVALERTSGGRKYILQDSTGGIALMLWQSILGDVSDRHVMGLGALVGTCGRVSIYDGELEVLPESALDVQVLQPVHMAVARVSLSELNPGHVGQVVSTVGQIARVRPFSGGYWLMLQEGPARVRLLLWEKLFQECSDRDRLAAGAWVSATGLIQAYEGVLEIVPERPEDVAFVAVGEAPPIERCTLSTLSQADVGKECQVEGRVVAVERFSQGIRLMVDDGAEAITVVIWSSILAQMRVAPEPGQGIRVRGEVAVYRGTLELVPGIPDDVVVASPEPQPTPTPGATHTPEPTQVLTQTARPAATATALPTSTPEPTVPQRAATFTPVPTPPVTPGIEAMATGKVSQEYVGRQVSVQGRLSEVERFASGLRSIVDDGSGRLVVWIPEEVVAQSKQMGRWAAGNLVSVTGTVQDYKGQVEVVPEGPEDLEVVQVAAPGPADVMHIGDVKADDRGKWVTVEGAITTVTPFSQGIKYGLDDGSGHIILLLWQNVLGVVERPERLAPGTVVRVTGKVDEYRGELEIVPGTGADIVFR